VVLGLLFGKAIKAHLFTPVVVASTFIIGGFIILWAERRQAKNPAVARIHDVESMTPHGRPEGWPGAVPGHDSGHQPQRCHHHWWHVARPVAQSRHRFFVLPGDSHPHRRRGLQPVQRACLAQHGDVPLFGVGLLFSFISAWLCIRWLLRYIATHSFVGFAYYRIAFGLVVLATAFSGTVRWTA
jgi:undecaprenyl-diphosphatase